MINMIIKKLSWLIYVLSIPILNFYINFLYLYLICRFKILNTTSMFKTSFRCAEPLLEAKPRSTKPLKIIPNYLIRFLTALS